MRCKNRTSPELAALNQDLCYFSHKYRPFKDNQNIQKELQTQSLTQMSNSIFVHIFTSLFCLVAAVEIVDYHYVNGETRYKSGYTHQTIELENPFEREFSISVSSPTDLANLYFKPNSIFIEEVSSMPLSTTRTTLLDSLRSPLSDEYRELLVFNNYIMILKKYNQVQILEQKNNTFQLSNNLIITQLGPGSLYFKAYPFKQKALLFAAEQAYLLSSKGYYEALKYDSETPIGMIAHVEQIEGSDLILIAQYSQGLSIYQVDQSSKKMHLKSHIDHTFFNRSFVSIEDVSTRQWNEGKLFILDRFSGVHEIALDVKDFKKKFTYVKLVSDHMNCHSMDTVDRQYFVLSCSLDGQNYLEELMIDQNDKPSELKPIFKEEYVFDLEATGDYYLSFSRKVINVYWSSRKNHLPEEYRIGNTLNLPGAELIKVAQSQGKYYLYAIANNRLIKYALSETKPVIEFKSNVPVQKSTEVSVKGPCESLKDEAKRVIARELGREFCVYTSVYHMTIAEPSRPEKSDISASISIIIILLVVLLILIWICLKKYRNLEHQAKKMLDEFKHRNPHRPHFSV